MLREAHPRSFVLLSLLFALFVLFLYGPTLTIIVLSFQGPEGGLVFPMQRRHRCTGSPRCSRPQSIGDIGGSFERSIKLGADRHAAHRDAVSFLAGLAFRKRFARLRRCCSTSPSPA